MVDLKDVDYKWVVNSGLGFLALALVLAFRLRRNGHGKPVLMSDSLPVQVGMLSDDLKRLSNTVQGNHEEVRRYFSAAERAFQERQTEMHGWHLHVVKTIQELRDERRSA